MTDIIVLWVVSFCVGSACYYIYKNRKKGIKCIGCPYAKSCSGGCGGTVKNVSKNKKVK